MFRFVPYVCQHKKTHMYVKPQIINKLNANTSACGAGTYSGEAASACTTCGAGKYSGAEGATAELTCLKCVAGTYSGVEGATAVTTCQGEFVSFREPELVWAGLFRGFGDGRGCLRGGGDWVWDWCGEI